MIPLHRPAFGLGTALAAALGLGRASSSLPELEAAYASATGCAQAVWLPSARAGICWALRAAINDQTEVIGPAFTCSVVHEAVVRSGGRPRFIDAGHIGFGMDLPTLHAAQQGNFALVLSEPYGHAYDLDDLARHATAKPKIRIADTAMAVPHRSLFTRLQGNDFAVISLGTGKSMFSGWGGMGLTHDPALAEEVRRIRDASLSRATAQLAMQRAIQTTARVAAHYPAVYDATRELFYWARKIRSRRQPQPTHTPATRAVAGDTNPEFPAEWFNIAARGPEWQAPSTYVDRRLALWNLAAAEDAHAARLALGKRYQANLADLRGLTCPPDSAFALSHYTVRVPAELREPVKERLRRAGVYTVSLWTFYPHMDSQKYPHAFRLSSEVINLPLAPWMRPSQVDQVCTLLAASLKACIAGEARR